MTTDSTTQGAAYRPPLRNPKDMTRLCDATMYAFGVMHILEIEGKRASKERLRAELAQLDLTELMVNANNVAAEEYQPSDRWGGDGQ